MSLDKHQLRTFYKELRGALSDQDLENKSLQVTSNVIEFLKVNKEFNHFHLFFPISKQREINTYPIKDYLDIRGGSIYTSRVAGDSLEMQTLLLKSNTRFKMDKWGIPIPEEFEIVSSELIEVFFVPLLVFDQKGNRIGFGKGYYDVLLAGLKPAVLKIGLSIFPPELRIPAEFHDIPLDYCITPENIITF